MKGLIIKDIKLMKLQRSFIVVLILLIAGMSIMAPTADFSAGFISCYLAILAPIFVVNTISYDEADNGLVFLFSLPFSRREYVIEKYLLGLLIGLVSIVAVMGLTLIVGFAKGSEDYLDMAIAMMTAFFGELFFLSLLVPLQLRLGSEKSRYATIAAIGCSFILGYFIVKLLYGMGINVEEYVNSISPQAMFTGAIVIDGCLLVASMLLSLRIIGKKEF